MSADESEGAVSYQRLAEDFRRQIAEGVLKPGDRLPSVRQVAERDGVATLTVQRAFGVLRGEKLIRSDVGKGTFVATDAKERARTASPIAVLSARVEELETRVRDLESRLNESPRPGES